MSATLPKKTAAAKQADGDHGEYSTIPTVVSAFNYVAVKPLSRLVVFDIAEYRRYFNAVMIRLQFGNQSERRCGGNERRVLRW